MAIKNKPYRVASCLAGTNRCERYIAPAADKAPMPTYQTRMIARAIRLLPISKPLPKSLQPPNARVQLRARRAGVVDAAGTMRALVSGNDSLDAGAAPQPAARLPQGNC